MHRQFGDHERSQEFLKASLRAVISTCSFPSALQTPECIDNLISTIKSVYIYELNGPSGENFLHEMARSISTPTWIGCQSIPGLPAALSMSVPIYMYTPGWREAL